MPFKIVKTTAGALKPGDCYEHHMDYAEAFAARLNSGERSKLWVWPKGGGFDSYFQFSKTIYKIVWEDDPEEEKRPKDDKLKDYIIKETETAQELLVGVHKHVENVRRVVSTLIDKGEDFDWDLRNDLEEIIYDIDEVDGSLLSFWAGIEAKFNKPKSESK